MVRSRTWTALAGILVSLLISVLAWRYFGTAVFFLFVPFVPFLFRRRAETTVRECPTCGFRTTDGSFAYCPRDGTELVRPSER